MPYSVLLKEAHALVDEMPEEKIEYVVRILRDACESDSTERKMRKKHLDENSIREMLSVARPCDFGESVASIQRFRELTKNDVW